MIFSVSVYKFKLFYTYFSETLYNIIHILYTNVSSLFLLSNIYMSHIYLSHTMSVQWKGKQSDVCDLISPTCKVICHCLLVLSIGSINNT